MCEVELHRKGARARHERIPLSISAFKKSNMIASQSTNDDSNNQIDNNDGNDDDLEYEMKDPRRPCKFCGRKFNPDRVEKHMRICNASKKKRKRKVWNGSERRVDGTVFEEFKYCRSRVECLTSTCTVSHHQSITNVECINHTCKIIHVDTTLF